MPSVVSLWRDLSLRARAGTAVALAALVVGVPLAAVGPVVRSKVAARAAARGFVAEVGRVRPSWGGVWLLDVGLRSRNGRIAGVIDAVRVPFGGGAVRVHGGRVALRGTVDELEREVASEKQGAEAGRRRLVEADGIALSARELDGRGTTIDVWGLALTRGVSEDRVRVDLVQARSAGGSVVVRGGELALGAPGPGRVRTGRAREASIVLEPDALRLRSSEGTSGAPVPVTRTGVALAIPVAMAVARQVLPAGAAFDVGSARFAVTYRGEHIGFGPSRVSVLRTDDAVTLAVTREGGKQRDDAARAAGQPAARGRLTVRRARRRTVELGRHRRA